MLGLQAAHPRLLYVSPRGRWRVAGGVYNKRSPNLQPRTPDILVCHNAISMRRRVRIPTPPETRGLNCTFLSPVGHDHARRSTDYTEES